jgi:hypothetical protein
VAGDLLALGRVDLREVHATVRERSVMLAEGFGE